MSGVFTIENLGELYEAVAAHIVREILVCDLPALNHLKYYVMEFDKKTREVQCQYGRIGASPQFAHYGETEGGKKLQEKLRKGYVKMNKGDFVAKYGSGKLSLKDV